MFLLIYFDFLQELTELTRLAHALEDSFCIVEKHYKDMSGAQKKLKLIPIVSTNEISVQNETAVTAFSNSDEVVIQFHILADRYADSIMELQALVRLKQSQIVPRTECTNEEKGAGHIGETHDVTPGADIDLLAGLARPLWLDVLMLKYSRHMIARSGTPPSAVVEAMGQNYPFCNPLNLGSFCSFLSCCLVGKISIVVLEHQALIEVRFFLTIWLRTR